jgi:hypothetical protein
MASGAGKTEATICVDDQPIQVPKPVELYRISLVIAGWPSEQQVDPNQLRQQQPEEPNGLAC